MNRRRSRSRARSKSRKRSRTVEYSRFDDEAKSVTLARYGTLKCTPLPKMVKAQMKYYTNISLNIGAAGSLASVVFRANSPYDPNQTGVGDQPRGFDQLMALYDHYVVIGSRITGKFTGGTNFVLGGITLLDSATAIGQEVDHIENPYCVWDAVVTEPKTLVQTFNNNFLGRSKPLSDPDLKGSASGNVTEGAYYHVWMASPAGTDESSITVPIMIEYTCMLIEPKDPGAS